MAYKPWYERVAEMNNQNEREEFIRGVFGFRPKDNHTLFKGLIAGYVGGTIAAKKAKKK